MLYEKKVERAMEWLKSKNNKANEGEVVEDEDATSVEDTNEEPSKIYYDEGFIEEEEPLEKKDILALGLSALLIIAPVVIAVLGVYVLIAYLMFG